MSSAPSAVWKNGDARLSTPSVADATFVEQLKKIFGRANVLIGARLTRRFRSGFRFGSGAALAVMRLGTLVEQWNVLKACVAADKIVIMLSANTGLTGGSTPDGDKYDRGIVLINTMRIGGLHLLNDGEQVVCLPGTTLFQLEKALRPLGREPHSVIGSTCIGASVFGGICNNSGGALIHQGPAYTQLAVYAQLDGIRNLRLINHLGIELGSSPEEILERLERGKFPTTDIDNDPSRSASDHGYAAYVRDVEAKTPTRFNADPQRFFEAPGSAGKIMVMAVRLDPFLQDKRTRVFYVGSNNTQGIEKIRRHVLSAFGALPISAEYIRRTAFKIAEKYGKDTFSQARRWACGSTEQVVI